MECEWSTAFSIAGLLGAALMLSWVAAYILSWAWAWVWAWVDDSKPPKANPLIDRVMKAMGWSDGNWLWKYKRGDQLSDGERGFFFPLIILGIAPIALVLAVGLYPITVGVFTLYLLAKLARFARRHKKLFDKHLKDPEAHK